MISSKEILAAAMRLPPEVRAQLAERLLDSLGDAPDSDHPALAAEIDRRVAEIEAGQAELIPHEQVMAMVREDLRSRRTMAQNRKGV